MHFLPFLGIRQVVSSTYIRNLFITVSTLSDCTATPPLCPARFHDLHDAGRVTCLFPLVVHVSMLTVECKVFIRLFHPSSAHSTSKRIVSHCQLGGTFSSFHCQQDPQGYPGWGASNVVAKNKSEIVVNIIQKCHHLTWGGSVCVHLAHTPFPA